MALRKHGGIDAPAAFEIGQKLSRSPDDRGGNNCSGTDRERRSGGAADGENSVMGGISRRAGTGRTARRSLRPRRLKPFPARLSLSAIANKKGTGAAHRSPDVRRTAEAVSRSDVIRRHRAAAALVAGASCSSSSARNSGNGPASPSCSAGADVDVDETQRLRQPAGAIEQTLGLLGHVAFLQMVDELRRRLALGLAHRLENARLGDTAEIVVDGRPPARASTMSSPTARARTSA